MTSGTANGQLEIQEVTTSDPDAVSPSGVVPREVGFETLLAENLGRWAELLDRLK